MSSRQGGPELASAPPWAFLPQLFPFQLTLAPRFLPNTLISVDFAANYLTKIYGLTFGQKPNLRSEVRGGPGLRLGKGEELRQRLPALSKAERTQTCPGGGACCVVRAQSPLFTAVVRDTQGLQAHWI